MILDEIKAFPELKRYKLIDNYSYTEHIVTYDQLKELFGDRLPAMFTNRDPNWSIEDYD